KVEGSTLHWSRKQRDSRLRIRRSLCAGPGTRATHEQHGRGVRVHTSPVRSSEQQGGYGIVPIDESEVGVVENTVPTGGTLAERKPRCQERIGIGGGIAPIDTDARLGIEVPNRVFSPIERQSKVSTEPLVTDEAHRGHRKLIRRDEDLPTDE